MKKVTALALMLGIALSFTLPARADEMEDAMMKSYCPMMSLKFSKELGLSKKQEAKLQAIKAAMWEQMKPVATKTSADTEEVLTAKQEAKYKELMAAQGSCGCGHKDGEEGGSCEGKKEKK